MRRVKELSDIVRNAEAFKTIGETDIHIYLREDEDDLDALPWNRVVEVTTGGLVRLGANVSLDFRAQHDSGLEFSWSVNIEQRGANGTSGFDIAKERLASILTKLPRRAREQMRGHLDEAADVVRENADKSMDWITKQYGQEGVLRALATSKDEGSVHVAEVVACRYLLAEARWTAEAIRHEAEHELGNGPHWRFPWEASDV